jgi:hypothetical protein
MYTGMLWFDNSKRSIGAKLRKAVEYYEKKHGKKPTLIYMNPRMWGEDKAETFTLGSITVRPYRPVLPGHIWIGIADEDEAERKDARR